MIVWLMIVGVVAFLLFALAAISILRIGAEADRQAEAAFRQMIQKRKEETDAAEKQIAL